MSLPVPAAEARPSRALLVAAFAIVYVVWGSTYLAMRIAVHTLPPFLLGGVRFSGAGLLLLAWSYRRAPRPVFRALPWRPAALTGVLLLVGGNGGVVWAVQVVPSGLAALVVACVPVWLVLLTWATQGRRPGALLIAGVLGGLGGVALLLGPGLLVTAGASAVTLIPPAAGLALLGASLSWAVGSLVAGRAPAVPGRPFLFSAMQMLVGGGALLLLGVATGELGQLGRTPITGSSVAALAYLLVFGSLVGYSAFAWLLRVAPPAQVATYAYVNPVIAVLLGWALGNEPLTTRIVVAAGVILAAVVLVTRGSLPVKSPAVPARASS